MRFAVREIVLAVRAAVGIYMLDSLAPAAFATSPRRLRSDYFGPAMRVRRSSDNAEADIAFLSDGDLDVYGLMNHVGGENLVTFSEQFDSAAWFKVGITVTPNYAAAPDGALTADRVQFSSSNRSLSISASLGVGVICSGSIFIRGNAGETIAISAGGVDQLFTLDGTMQRLKAQNKTSVANTFNVNTYGGATARDVVVWGAQLNTGATPRDYCRTTSAPTVDGSGFVATMYDQSGNGRNLMQATAANQPRIVNAGVIDRMSSGTARPMMRTDGVSQYATSGNLNIPQPFTRSSVIQLLNVTQGLIFDTATNPENALFISSLNSLSMYAGNIGPTKSVLINDAATVVETFAGASATQSFNGALIGPSTAGINGITSLRVASWSGLTVFGNALYGDIIIFPSALSTADRQSLEASQKSYYGTP